MNEDAPVVEEDYLTALLEKTKERKEQTLEMGNHNFLFALPHPDKQNLLFCLEQKLVKKDLQRYRFKPEKKEGEEEVSESEEE